MIKKKRRTAKKVIFYTFITIIVLVSLAILMFKQSQKIPNSFKNTGYFGNALYYDTLNTLGYKVRYEVRPVTQLNTKELVVLNISAKTYALSDEEYQEIFEYVENGGKMLVLMLNASAHPLQVPDGWPKSDTQSAFERWQTNQDGVLMFGDIYDLNNVVIANDREASYEILKTLHSYIQKEGIVFNEYYLFASQGGKRTLWREIPQGIQFILYQLLLVLILFIAYKGKRSGAPHTLYEESEPDEHQYAKAVGDLYYQAGHWEVLIDAYYHQFIQKIYHKNLLYSDVDESNWVETFEQHREHKLAVKVNRFMQQYKEGAFKDLSKRKRNKKIKEMLLNIQHLEKSIDD